MPQNPSQIEALPQDSTLQFLQEEFSCKCSGNIHHHLISPKGRYGFWSWLALMTGISAKPKQIFYYCTLCHKNIATTENLEVLKRHY